jgi:hypothetical protein
VEGGISKPLTGFCTVATFKRCYEIADNVTAKCCRFKLDILFIHSHSAASQLQQKCAKVSSYSVGKIFVKLKEFIKSGKTGYMCVCV